MKKITAALLALSFLSAAESLSAQSLEEAVVEEALERQETLALEMVNQAFTPMTEFKAGELHFTAAGGLFDITRLNGSPEIKGAPLTGIPAGAGIGLALSDQLLLYTAWTGIFLQGTITGDFFGMGAHPAETGYQLHNLFAGAGFELLQTGTEQEFGLTLPLYLGFNASFYDGHLTPEPITVPVDALLEATTAGSGFLLGLSGGGALKLRYRGFSLIGFVVIMQNFNGASFSTETRLNGSSSASSTHSVSPYAGGTAGLRLLYANRRGWHAGISFGTGVQWDGSGEDLQYRSLIISAGYKH